MDFALLHDAHLQNKYNGESEVVTEVSTSLLGSSSVHDSVHFKDNHEFRRPVYDEHTIDRRGKISTIQCRYIKSLKEKYSTEKGKKSPGLLPFWHDPTPQNVYQNWALNEEPDVSEWYLKPVLMFAPHLNFQRADPIDLLKHMKCPSTRDCKGKPKKKEWNHNPPATYVHDLTGGYYFCQYRYECSECSQQCEALKWCNNVHEFQIIRDDLKVPIFTENFSDCGVSPELLSEIVQLMSGTITTTCIMSHLRNLRIQRFIALRRNYNNLVRRFQFARNSTKEFPRFSSMDDVQGYNEVSSMSEPFMIKCFNTYVEKWKEDLQECIENAEIPEVISFDTTMRIQCATRLVLLLQ